MKKKDNEGLSTKKPIPRGPFLRWARSHGRVSCEEAAAFFRASYRATWARLDRMVRDGLLIRSGLRPYIVYLPTSVD